MKKHKYIIILILILVLLQGFMPIKPSVVILYTTNTNGVINPCNCPDSKGGIFRRMTKIKYYKKAYPDAILLDTGDFLLPTHDDKINSFLLQVMKKMKYDCIGLGDQELDGGIEFFVNEVKKYDVPILATNIIWCDKDKSCNFFSNSYVIKNVGRYKVGIIALLTEDDFKYYPEELREKLIIFDPIDETKKWMEFFRKKAKTDITIVLSHGGHEFDKELASKVKNIDIIIGGHNQVLLAKGLKANNTLILQMGRNGEYLGKLSLYLDENKKIVKYENRAYPLDKTVKDDEEIRKLFLIYSKR